MDGRGYDERPRAAAQSVRAAAAAACPLTAGPRMRAGPQVGLVRAASASGLPLARSSAPRALCRRHLPKIVAKSLQAPPRHKHVKAGESIIVAGPDNRQDTFSEREG